MCRVNIVWCSSCNIYSPIVTLQPHEEYTNYSTVHDVFCRQYNCLKKGIVNTPWVPLMDRHLLVTCALCNPVDCNIIVFRRDCNIQSKALRKLVSDVWTQYYKLNNIC